MNRAEWDLHAAKFESMVCDIVTDETGSQMPRFVASACRSRKNLELVDLGCGVGSFVKKFGHRFEKITGIDFAPRIVARAKKRCGEMPNATWLAMDVCKSADVLGRVADLAVCLNVITSPREAKRDALWSTLAAVTKPSGHALVVVPSMESQLMVNKLGASADKIKAGGLVSRDGVWQKFYEREELISTVSDKGFNVTRIAKVYYPWSVDGLRKPRGSKQLPWDWGFLAQRAA